VKRAGVRHRWEIGILDLLQVVQAIEVEVGLVAHTSVRYDGGDHAEVERLAG